MRDHACHSDNDWVVISGARIGGGGVSGDILFMCVEKRLSRLYMFDWALAVIILGGDSVSSWSDNVLEDCALIGRT